MTKADVLMIKELAHMIERFTSEDIRKKIVEGSDRITADSSKEDVARFVQDAMRKMDRILDEKTRIHIMEAFGRNCARVNRKVIERAKARRKKYSSVDAFIEAETAKSVKGTRLVREDDTLYQYYMPEAFTRPMRCFCSLLRGLPEDERVSSTYCHCSKAFVQRMWEEALGKSLQAELLQSVISGSHECKFAIHLS